MNRWMSAGPGAIPSSLELFSELFDFIHPESTILDAGCGPGRACGLLAERGYSRVFGIDINPGAVVSAVESLRAAGGKQFEAGFAAADVTALPFIEDTFDAVVAQALFTVLPPVGRQNAAREFARVLRPGGVLYITDFGQNWDIPLYRKRYEEGMEKGYERGSFDAVSATGGLRFIARHFTGDEILQLLRDAGLQQKLYSPKTVVTQSGNHVSGHLAIGMKK